MSNHLFLDRINTTSTLIADGATGTNLIARGLPSGAIAESWVLEQPEKIIQLHRDFITAGADIILTSTFNGNSMRLKESHLDGKMELVNQKAVMLAREAAAETHTFVAGSLGPLGLLMKPLGLLTPEDAVKAYADQAKVISDSGADLLVIETQFDLEEVKSAIQGTRSVSDLPLVVSMSYDRGRRTMMGVSPAQAAKVLNELPVDVIGINCGHSLEDNLLNLIELRNVTAKPIWFKPNAGLPQVDKQGITFYGTSPEMMGVQVPAWLEAGAKIIGGCCGTSPEHLREISKKIK